MPAMSATELDWQPGPGNALSAWMGFWELTVRPAYGGDWNFQITNPMGDCLTGHRVSQAVAIADCHEMAERLTAGRE